MQPKGEGALWTTSSLTLTDLPERTSADSRDENT